MDFFLQPFEFVSGILEMWWFFDLIISHNSTDWKKWWLCLFVFFFFIWGIYVRSLVLRFEECRVFISIDFNYNHHHHHHLLWGRGRKKISCSVWHRKYKFVWKMMWNSYVCAGMLYVYSLLLYIYYKGLCFPVIRTYILYLACSTNTYAWKDHPPVLY